MRRYFNTTGPCNPKEHYMVEPLRGLYGDIAQLIENKQYFLIHAPRQTGKTTLLHQLTLRLNREGKYNALTFSVESAGVPGFSEELANERMIQALWRMCPIFLPPEAWPPKPPERGVTLLNYLTDWARAQTRPIVLFIDEADSLWDDVLVSFLRQLRDGFQTRPENFPQSIALVGLRDIREYRLKARGENPSLGSGSPFNVKAESFFLPAFSEQEVRSLLQQHTDDTGQVFTEEAIEKIYECSGGQPWLTNALAHEIVAKMLKNDYSRPITPDLVEEAKERLIEQRQTHLDSLADKISEPRVRPIVMGIISGESIHFDGFDDALRYCRDLGIITTDDPIRFANPIYQEIITRVLNSSLQRGINPDIAQVSWYVRADGSLDMDKLLEAFVNFYRRHSESWLERFEYKEAGHQLLLMAFLQRIVNGGGRIEREMALGNGRTDLAVFWKKQVIPIELKIRYDKWSESEGIEQLSGYMDRLGQRRGYLVLFEKKPASELPWEERIRREVHEVDGKEIILLGM
ncbi:MAG: AAA-like domain-containing protein [Saprospiraceae bacterium]|nr:AAA-like domain-containing protein [Saprospiraceae bacterium]MDW8229371.1 AAA-like domain-containing protein [Saprospiraceae bacterium]